MTMHLWDDEIIGQMEGSSDEELDAFECEYKTCLNAETLEAQRKLDAYVAGLLEQLTGVVCDLATGRGVMLKKLLQVKGMDFKIFCSDVDKRILAITRRHRKTDDERVFYVVNDVRKMCFGDNSFDYLTTDSGFGNIPNAEKYATELFRVLKPGGMLISMGMFIDKDSESFRLATSVGVERGVVEEYLLAELKGAGFEIVESTVIATAVWGTNPYDLIPAAGDRKHFCVVRARKPNQQT